MGFNKLHPGFVITQRDFHKLEKLQVVGLIISACVFVQGVNGIFLAMLHRPSPFMNARTEERVELANHSVTSSRAISIAMMPTVKYSFFAIDAFLNDCRSEKLGIPGGIYTCSAIGLKCLYLINNDVITIKQVLLVNIPRIILCCK